jgi:uncharacterized protein (TIGR00369 family)
MEHFKRLIGMYKAAPIHNFYEGIEMKLEKQRAEITLPIDERYFHAAMSAHGSVYFKLMDDAAYFACQTEIEDFFIVTTSFNIQLIRPIKKGVITAVGTSQFISRQLISGSSKLYDEKGRLCGTGQGQFLKSKLALDDVVDY